MGLFKYVATFSHDTILLGDFNLHHRDWSPTELIWKQNKASRIFQEATKACELKLKTKPGTITYSKSKKESESSSTIDLPFTSSRISSSVTHCGVLPDTGFNSDRRIIETRLQRDVSLQDKFKLDWSNVDQKSYQRELASLLPSVEHPTDSAANLDNLAQQIISAVKEAIRACVPTITVQNPIRRLNQLEKDLEKLKRKIDAVNPDTPRGQARLKQLWRYHRMAKREMWHIFTENESQTPTSSFALAKLAQRISQPIGPCQVPSLQHGGESAVTDEEKISLFKRVTFRMNDHPKSKKVPSPPRTEQTPQGKKIPVDMSVTDEQLLNLINKAPKGKSADSDGITNEAIQRGGTPLRHSLL
ncbi:zinc knuckle [Fusarium longipes]|uniref:Zinc knuckle n=1 Tax=Fusarium longipes TaxID=694270 RepID=A0A395RW68_9HYPO|nr:zinc knuckle [Fusarium longipes]